MIIDLEIAKFNKQPSQITGIYFLFQDEDLVYIGQSKDILSRIEFHKNLKLFNHFYFEPCNIGHLLQKEAENILKYRPKYNKSVNFSVTDYANRSRLKAYTKDFYEAFSGWTPELQAAGMGYIEQLPVLFHWNGEPFYSQSEFSKFLYAAL